MRRADEEHAAITILAEKRGMSPGALIRLTLLNVPPTPGVRRPTVDTKLLAQGAGRAGQDRLHINQIADNLNAGRPGDVMEGSIDAAMNELLEWRMALMQALGYERNRKHPEN